MSFIRTWLGPNRKRLPLATGCLKRNMKGHGRRPIFGQDDDITHFWGKIQGSFSLWREVWVSWKIREKKAFSYHDEIVMHACFYRRVANSINLMADSLCIHKHMHARKETCSSIRCSSSNLVNLIWQMPRLDNHLFGAQLPLAISAKLYCCFYFEWNARRIDSHSAGFPFKFDWGFGAVGVHKGPFNLQC